MTQQQLELGKILVSLDNLVAEINAGVSMRREYLLAIIEAIERLIHSIDGLQVEQQSQEPKP